MATRTLTRSFRNLSQTKPSVTLPSTGTTNAPKVAEIGNLGRSLAEALACICYAHFPHQSVMSMPNCIRQSQQCHILSSSHSEFGTNKSGPFRESQQINPRVFVTCSTRPRIQGKKLPQKQHFSTCGRPQTRCSGVLSVPINLPDLRITATSQNDAKWYY